jgi:cell fate (sporulation/competence/biofilm development) regulator YlbF (YheA/YmcA/DUF963 family)
MERVLKGIDRLASTLAAKLKESKDHKQLDQMIKDLSKYASTLLTCRSAITNTDVHRSLEEEDEKIKAMHKRGFIVRLAHNSDDAGEIVSSCQAIKDALDIFYVSRSP